MPAPIRPRPHAPAQRRRADGRGGTVGAQKQEADASAGRSGELQASAGREIEPVDLAHHPRQSRGAQRLLHGPEQLRRAGRGEQDHLAGREAVGGERRRIEIAFSQGGPEHAPAGW